MKKWTVALVFLSLSTGVLYADSPAMTPPPTKGVHVEKAAIGTAIDNKEISGTGSEFEASVGRVYCWTRITAEQVPTQVKHVWSVDDKKEAEVALDIKYPATRTWSSKSVWPGHWKVETMGESGELLNTVEFTVKAPATK